MKQVFDHQLYREQKNFVKLYSEACLMLLTKSCLMFSMVEKSMYLFLSGSRHLNFYGLVNSL